jgi:cyclopropane fatty-acyl-phospholipid synthase-like methyltransferase
LAVSGHSWYEEFFNQDYLRVYGHTLSDEQTQREVTFVCSALGLGPGDKVLDLCCGNGRHSLLMARQGLCVTGMDLNEGLLEQARRKATGGGLGPEFVRGDMRAIPYTDWFNAVINMFSSFGYLESEEEDFRALVGVRKALKRGGRLLLDMLNREWVVSNYIQNEWHEDDRGTLLLEHREIDLLTNRNHITFTLVSPDGTTHESVGHHIRLYTLTEMVRMLEKAGLQFDEVYGGFEGEPYGVDTRRMIVVARKPA